MLDELVNNNENGQYRHQDIQRFRSVISQQKSEIQRLRVENEKYYGQIMELQKSLRTCPESLVKGMLFSKKFFLFFSRVKVVGNLSLNSIAKDVGFGQDIINFT